jgi:benzaldehyde dehydrogenase (NAD)
MLNSGQICMSTERILAHRDIVDDLQSEIQLCLKEVGDRAFEIVRPGSVKAVQEMVTEAKNEVSRSPFTGTRLPINNQGARHFSPSSGTTETTLTAQIVYDPSPSSRIWSEETFSPTVTLSSFDSTDLILEALHSVPTGLSTSIFGSLSPALELSQQVESGMVHINSMTVHDEYGLPFGGVRDSGWGRFNGQGAIESFTWKKNVSIGKGGKLPLHVL